VEMDAEGDNSTRSHSGEQRVAWLRGPNEHGQEPLMPGSGEAAAPGFA